MNTHTMSLPFSGSSPISRHRSAQAAEAASKRRGAKMIVYLKLLAEAGERGLSDHEAAAVTGWALSSICSIRNHAWLAGFLQPGTRVAISPYDRKVTTWVRAPR